MKGYSFLKKNELEIKNKQKILELTEADLNAANEFREFEPLGTGHKCREGKRIE